MNEDYTNNRPGIGDQLVALEPLSPDFQKRLQEELQTMFVRELHPASRFFCGLVAVVSVGIGLLCGYLAVTELKLPLMARIGLGTGALFGFAWGVAAGRVCWRGAMDLKIDNRRIASMAWIFTVLMMVFFLFVGMSAEDRQLGLLMIVQGLAFLIGAGVNWVTHRIEQSELAMREKLLQLELRIAELCERR
jgi:hypothetical protein